MYGRLRNSFDLKWFAVKYSGNIIIVGTVEADTVRWSTWKWKINAPFLQRIGKGTKRASMTYDNIVLQFCPCYIDLINQD